MLIYGMYTLVSFRKFSEFPRGTMYDILQDAYSFDSEIRKYGIKTECFIAPFLLDFTFFQGGVVQSPSRAFFILIAEAFL